MVFSVNELKPYREEIDRIDDQIVNLLAQRFSVCSKVAHVKAKTGIPVRIPERIAEVRNRCATRGAEQGLSYSFVTRIYSLIIEETCLLEEGVISAPHHQDSP
ncbi:4-amino-4-deoxychorismate mutase [Azospirillaceae bacterium]